MTDDPENHTVRLLQEMRAEMRERFAGIEQRIDGNTLILNMLAGLIHDHEQRIDTIETRAR